jgi:hypothetical protein
MSVTFGQFFESQTGVRYIGSDTRSKHYDLWRRAHKKWNEIKFIEYLNRGPIPGSLEHQLQNTMGNSNEKQSFSKVSRKEKR